MNFGQALAALLNGSSITRAGWQRQGMSLILQPAHGIITDPFIVRRLNNGQCSVYTPSNADILTADWAIVSQEENRQGATQGLREQEHASHPR